MKNTIMDEPKQSTQSKEAWSRGPRCSLISGVALGASHVVLPFLQPEKGNIPIYEVFPRLCSTGDLCLRSSLSLTGLNS